MRVGSGSLLAENLQEGLHEKRRPTVDQFGHALGSSMRVIQRTSAWQLKEAGTDLQEGCQAFNVLHGRQCGPPTPMPANPTAGLGRDKSRCAPSVMTNPRVCFERHLQCTLPSSDEFYSMYPGEYIVLLRTLPLLDLPFSVSNSGCTPMNG